MFLPNIQFEINGGMVPLKDYKEDPLLKSKVPLWVRSRKLPLVEYDEVIPNSKQTELKHRGVPPAFVSNFFLQRLEEDSSDVLGSIVIGELEKEIESKYSKTCYLLPKPYSNLPRNTEGHIFVWVPPASHLTIDSDSTKESVETQNGKIELISQTFTDYNNRLKEYYIILPKNFLSDKTIRNLRTQFLGKTSFALVLKIKPYFNAVMLKISNTCMNTDKIPCKILPEQIENHELRETESYRLYFKHLAAEIMGFEPNWVLNKDGQKATILPISKSNYVIGDFINIIHLNRGETQQTIETKAPDVNNSDDSNHTNLLRKDRVYYAIDAINDSEPFIKVKDLDSGDVVIIPSKDIPFPRKLVAVCKNDLVIKARTPMSISNPPYDGITVLLPNHYYIIKLEPKYENDPRKCDLMTKIQKSITSFYKTYKEEMDCLGTIGFELLKKIPLIEG